MSKSRFIDDEGPLPQGEPYKPDEQIIGVIKGKRQGNPVA